MRALAEADPASIHLKDRITGQTPFLRLLSVANFIPSSYPMNPAEAVTMLLKINPTPVEEPPSKVFDDSEMRLDNMYRRLAMASPPGVQDAVRKLLNPSITPAAAAAI